MSEAKPLSADGFPLSIGMTVFVLNDVGRIVHRKITGFQPNKILHEPSDGVIGARLTVVFCDGDQANAALRARHGILQP